MNQSHSISKQAISITLTPSSVVFVDTLARKGNSSKSEVIDRLLALYRREYLRTQLTRSTQETSNEDVRDAMSDFASYASIISNYENATV